MSVPVIQHVQLKVWNLLVAFSLGYIFGGIMSMIVDRFSADPMNASAVPHRSALPLVCIPGLRRALQNMEIETANNLATALLRILAHDIRVINILIDSDPLCLSECRILSLSFYVASKGL
jgi:hypothetical protein